MAPPQAHLPAARHSDVARAGKVAALICDAPTITVATAILTDRADNPGRFTAPAGTPARASQDRLTQLLQDASPCKMPTLAR